FDVKAVADVEVVDDDVRELLELAKEIEEQVKEARLGGEEEGEADELDDELDDDDESWVDEVKSLTGDERKEFEKEVRPVKMVLVKIRRLAFKIVHLTTKILPAWHDILEQKGLPSRLIPRDVKTRWNSTFDMLNVAIEYQGALDDLCAAREHGL
ncbi:uncharacterized protein TRAVEDRAFT_78090, partial [Trametes versicolor FP-101664 SS1]|uniref:uncharacterized protein n=1 Tax=Trametes versicolor (strain FP-101664) TaxID=717944 RepID=UPI000462153D